MSKYIVTGGNQLKGVVKISGNKNEVLPCMAATLLTKQPITLTNVPKIKDVEVFKELLELLGTTITEHENGLTLQTDKILTSILPVELTNKLRASILLVGPLLARAGRAVFDHPGGDVIGKRSIDVHIDGFKELGYEVKQYDQNYQIHSDRKVNSQVSIFMLEASATGTENLILNSVGRKGRTILKNCPGELNIINLCTMLNKMGAKISGIGSTTITIDGVDKFTGTEFNIAADHIEMATYAAAAGLTGGEIVIEGGTLDNLEPIIYPLEKAGLIFKKEADQGIRVSTRKLRAIENLKTNIWPGFPTDLMSVMIVLATQAQGVSLLHDWMYESRMFFVDKLISMGAHITIADPHRVLVYGPTKLYARNMETPDIRAGIALVLAALVAEGTSVINHADLIERGYNNVVGNLSGLSARIERIE